ncbi:phytoene desaturase family protein [Ktedonospora formicarum]|uniref:Dehydrogenase n=1 Tax=Ktedonospora formicarum TaxID=2778364 RepID=A0A8J3MVQ9_9CHLR|nr:NAD(P)/FAD-dependent oxidoreductase [Ktedonospora formicarum]GHO48191.1 dehydrogenase [Ktedonospora formicarum]
MQELSPAPYDVVIVGGGLAGLTAASYLARGGRSVLLLEKASQLGGRAITTERHGFLFNRGIHALYLTGPGEAVLRDLNVTYQGKRSERERYEVDSQGNFHRLPSNAVTLRTTSLLNDESRTELGQLLMRLATLNPETLMGTNLQDWLDQSVVHPVVRQFVEAGARLATYTHAPQLLDAGVALEFIGKRPDALRIDGGWQTLVDGLTTAARQAGAQLETRARVVAIETGQEDHLIRLADGSAFQAKAVVLALQPALAAQLVVNGPREILHSYAEQTIPLYAACLDLALRRVPNPERFTVLHLDRPLFYANHAPNVRLAPEGGALLHLIKYLGPDEKNNADNDHAELEAWLDQLQPGWREEVVSQQFLPHILVSSDMLQARRKGLAGRPGPAVPSVNHLYVAGDWVGDVDHLANASLVSASQAAKMILARAE